MTERAVANPVEPRWPVVLTIFVAIILLMGLPSRFRLLPNGAVYVAGALVIVPMVVDAMWLQAGVDILLGLALVALSVPRGAIRHRYGDWSRHLI